MFNIINSYWNNWGFEILVGLSVFIILILFLVNYFTKDKGGYSKNIYSIGGRADFKPSEYIDDDGSGGFMSKLEFKAKIILEGIFNRPFMKIRPDFLRNDVTGQNLEIDLYNDELKLGVEINGNQHYKFTPFFQKNKEAFYNQRYRDEMKKDKCAKNGITLIEVPYKVGEKNLKSYIVEKLRLMDYLV
jgi:hypothetical protein